MDEANTCGECRHGITASTTFEAVWCPKIVNRCKEIGSDVTYPHALMPADAVLPCFEPREREPDSVVAERCANCGHNEPSGFEPGASLCRGECSPLWNYQFDDGQWNQLWCDQWKVRDAAKGEGE